MLTAVSLSVVLTSVFDTSTVGVAVTVTFSATASDALRRKGKILSLTDRQNDVGSSVVAKPCLLIVTEYLPGVSCGALKPPLRSWSGSLYCWSRGFDFDVRARHDSAVRVLRGSSNCSGCDLTLRARGERNQQK